MLVLTLINTYVGTDRKLTFPAPYGHGYNRRITNKSKFIGKIKPLENKSALNEVPKISGNVSGGEKIYLKRTFSFFFLV